MNKIIKNNTVVLVFVDLLIFISLFVFKSIYTSIGFVLIVVNIYFILNIILFLLGCFFVFILIREPNLYDEKKSILVIVSIFIIYLLLNTIGIYLINKPFSKGYTQISKELSSYCDEYMCDKYDTIITGSNRDFIIKKSYFDYNGTENNIVIHTKYNNNYILEIMAIITSRKELFSENLIKNELKGYFDNFNADIDEELIKKAFDNRKNGKVKRGNSVYKVSEVYNDGILTELKTEINITLRQD